jgi:ABC-2 type transport system ATP-binding protein
MAGSFIFAHCLMAISVENLSKRYGAQWAVKELSFSAASGEIVGFLGPNGAGKSTTMKIITGYLAADGGSVAVCGLNPENQSMEVRRRIGYLPEHNPLYLDMYVREYLAFAGGLSGLRGKHLKKRVDEMIDITGLGLECHKHIAALSKGYRQRVGLAQALIHDPEVLILDEPTSGLDPNQVLDIRQLITALGKEKTVMLSTHIMQEVEAICDRVVIINKGQKVADDRLENLRSQSAGNQSVRIQFASPVQEAFLQQIGEDIQYAHLGDNRWRLTAADSNLRQRASQFALKHNLEVLELAAERNSLEEIFQTLTRRVDDI